MSGKKSNICIEANLFSVGIERKMNAVRSQFVEQYCYALHIYIHIFVNFQKDCNVSVDNIFMKQNYYPIRKKRIMKFAEVTYISNHNHGISLNVLSTLVVRLLPSSNNK